MCRRIAEEAIFPLALKDAVKHPVTPLAPANSELEQSFGLMALNAQDEGNPFGGEHRLQGGDADFEHGVVWLAGGEALDG